jgi:hypothetical protein
MAALDIPGLFRSGAVCASWHDASCTFRRLRRPSPKQGPCLLYACDEYGPNHAAMYCPNTDTTFRVPFRHHGRGLFFSSNGWVFATDEAADPYLLNPVTGIQAMLPSVKTLPGIDTCKVNFVNDDGTVSASASEDFIEWARDCAYCRVAISTGHDAAATCTVLLVHMPYQKLSFAKPGDERWTLISDELYMDDVRYNDKDSMFYGLHFDGSVYVIDLSEPSPVMTRIMCGVTITTWGNPTKYLTITPSGELWQVWRMWTEEGLKHRWTYQDVLRYTSEECIEFTGKDDDEKLGKLELDMEEDTVTTCKLLIFKVDVDRQKLVELRSIGEHALFLGYNTAACLPTMEFPAFEPNRAYLSDDCSMYASIIRRDLGIWNLEKRSLQNLREAWPNLSSWLDLMAPIWITPSLC